MLTQIEHHIGAANTARVTGSPLGVMTAATTTMISIAYLNFREQEAGGHDAEPRQEEHQHRHLEHQAERRG